MHNSFKSKIKNLVTDYNSLLICLVLILGSIIFLPRFMKPANLQNIAIEVSMLGIFTIGMSMLLLIGHFDMSLGMQMTFGCFVMASTINVLGIFPAIILTLLSCMALGFINGIIITKLRVNSWITTFAMQGTLTGVCLAVCNGNPIYVGNEQIVKFFDLTILGIPISMIIFLVLAVLCQLMLKYTKLGYNMYMLGGNQEAATYSGISVVKMTVFAFVLCSFIVGFGSVLTTFRVNAYNPTMGKEYTLATLTAAIVGGISFSGGKGTMYNTMLGALAMRLVNNIMNLSNTYGYYIDLVNGGILVLVLIIDTIARNAEKKSAAKKAA